MRTTRFPVRGRVCPTPSGGRPPKRNMGPETETALEGTWDQAVRQEVTSYRDPNVNRQTGVKTLPCHKLRLRAVIITWRLEESMRKYKHSSITAILNFPYFYSKIKIKLNAIGNDKAIFVKYKRYGFITVTESIENIIS